MLFITKPFSTDGTDRQPNRQIDRQTGKQTDRQNLKNLLRAAFILKNLKTFITIAINKFAFFHDTFSKKYNVR